MKKHTKKKMKRWQKVLLVILVIIIILMAAAFLILRHMFTPAAIDSAKASDTAVVETQKGTVRGSNENGIYQYLGIPYAQAEEMFVPSQETEAWEGVLDATQCGPVSPQSSMLGMSGGTRSDEDNNCQNLNIWTPSIEDGKKRAVMVWLHGGGFSTGSANEEQYNGAELSRFGDVVVVSVNHRLGAVGFLDLSAYGEKYRYSGNAGLTDMVNALLWIRENIEHFGGDPENVTLFGQSGGGAKVLALMTTPYAKGLFQRGIVQSGATETMGVTFSSQEVSAKLTERILQNLGISGDGIELIQQVSLSDLQKASDKAMQETAREFKIPAPLTDGYAMEWGPVVDGEYIPTNPVTEDSFAENAKGIDLLIGSNLNEWAGFMGQNREEVSQEVISAYQEAYPDKDPGKANMVDSLLRLPLLKIMTHKADQGDGAVYAYVFTYSENGQNVGHGAEIPYVFHHVTGNSTSQKMADQICQAWVNFAKTGIPSAEGLPDWKMYDREKGATMLLDAKSALRYGHDRKLMRILKPEYIF